MFYFHTDPTVERYVLTFTLRDSPDCFVNVSCWGGEQHVIQLASQFHIGHVGEISLNTWLVAPQIAVNSDVQPYSYKFAWIASQTQ